jgi:hypothetical protein
MRLVKPIPLEKIPLRVRLGMTGVQFQIFFNYKLKLPLSGLRFFLSLFDAI